MKITVEAFDPQGEALKRTASLELKDLPNIEDCVRSN
jgi:hypothetical protein